MDAYGLPDNFRGMATTTQDMFPGSDELIREYGTVLFKRDKSGGTATVTAASSRCGPSSRYYWSLPARASLAIDLVKQLRTCEVSPWCVPRAP